MTHYELRGKVQHMDILLINTNPIISRLISYSLQEHHVYLNEIGSLDTLDDGYYELVLVDDAILETTSTDKLMPVKCDQMVLLTNTANRKPLIFDHVITKPFLPSQIIQLIQEELEPEPEKVVELPTHPSPAQDNYVLNIGEVNEIKSLLALDEEIDQENIEKPQTPIEDIEKLKREVIKQTLLDEGLEIIEEDVLLATFDNGITVNIAHNHHQHKEKFEAELLDAIEKEKFKKIKKLLKNTTIDMTIHFKDDE